MAVCGAFKASFCAAEVIVPEAAIVEPAGAQPNRRCHGASKVNKATPMQPMQVATLPHIGTLKLVCLFGKQLLRQPPMSTTYWVHPIDRILLEMTFPIYTLRKVC